MHLTTLQELYAQIPTFTCKPGCTACCGPIPWAAAEWAQITDKRKATHLTCPYAVKGQGCAVYAHRPLICRLFGAVDSGKLVCPRGCGPALPLPAHVADAMLRRYIAAIAHDPIFNHEFKS